MSLDREGWTRLFVFVRRSWVPILGSLLVVCMAPLFAPRTVSMWTIVAGLLSAMLGGGVSGIALATFLARDTARNRADTQAAGKIAQSTIKETAAGATPLDLSDPLDSLPDIQKDHVKVASMYGVNTIGQLADATAETKEKLKRAFGKALFLRSFAIATDCKQLTTGNL